MRRSGVIGRRRFLEDVRQAGIKFARIMTSLEIIFLAAFTAVALVLAAELDIFRFRCVKIMHPRTNFFCALLLITFFFGLGYAVNELGVPRGPGVIAFGAATIVWGIYGHFRTRHMWPAE